jgi:hypothetical protein
LNWNLEAGKTYRLLLSLSAGSYSLNYNNVDYSSTTWNNLGTSGVILSGFDSSPTTILYSNYYNMQLTSVCASPRVAVPVTVNPAPALTISGLTTTICSGVATTVPVTVTSAVADFDTYTWSPSTGVTGNSTIGWTFNPATTTTYTLTASQTAGSLCSNTVNYVVNANPLPSALAITPATPTVCVDSVQALSITGGTISSNGKIGSGTLINTTSTPFKGNRGGSKSQALYTASELNSLGMTAGKSISSIGYVALSGYPLLLSDFTINAGFVSNSDLGTSFISGASNVVLAPVNYTPTTGIGTIDFALSTPLVWDGVSNLLVETCFNNSNGGGPTTASISVESSAVTTGLNIFLTQDYNPDLCEYVTGSFNSPSRPNLRVTIDETANITWLPVTNLFTDAAATTPYTLGTNASTVYVKPASVATTDYTATATTSLTGCTTTTTASVVVNPPPSAPTGSATQAFSVAALADATIEDLVVTGTGVVWYATEDDAIAGTNALAAGTQLVSGTTYYAVSIAGGCSSTPFSVTVTVTLGNNSFDSTNLKVYPNPVVDVFTVKYNKEIESIKVFDLSGRLVIQESPKQLEAQVDMTELAAAMYIVKVNAGGKQAEIKVMKK